MRTEGGIGWCSLPWKRVFGKGLRHDLDRYKVGGYYCARLFLMGMVDW